MSEPYLPFYVGDYLRDTGFLTLEQHGAYLMLLMRLWAAGGSLPGDEDKLARLAGVSLRKWRPLWAELHDFFEHRDGAITHKRISAELVKAGQLRAKRAAAGARGAAANILKNHASPPANAEALPGQIRPDQLTVKAEPEGSAKTRPSRLSPDWVLPDAFRRWAEARGLPAERCDIEATRMLNWSINAGRRGLKADWFRAWQNWVLSAIDELPRSRPAPGPVVSGPVATAPPLATRSMAPRDTPANAARRRLELLENDPYRQSPADHHQPSPGRLSLDP
ncbi:MAG TPA: DUF1376 domain-containing protein [Devosiaceae bacterium]|jgi:uncharacterized protein YdaU (DUF1376 family)